jgi:acid phosphatase class B
MKTIICDLDGTLCDASHRDHLAKAKKWDEFNAASVNDPAHQDVVDFLKAMMAQGNPIAFVTGRSYGYRVITQEWIEDVLGIPAEEQDIYMRNERDFRSDVVIKKEIYETYLSEREILLALDDRDQVVAMWRSLGFRCWQVQPGAY